MEILSKSKAKSWLITALLSLLIYGSFAGISQANSLNKTQEKSIISSIQQMAPASVVKNISFAIITLGTLSLFAILMIRRSRLMKKTAILTDVSKNKSASKQHISREEDAFEQLIQPDELMQTQKLEDTSNFPITKNLSLYSEESFNKLLELERKRSERSGNIFLLLLLKIDKTAYPLKETNRLTRRIIHLIYECTREIDIKGWYRNFEVIGVIFPDIKKKNLQIIRDKIEQKINQHPLYKGKNIIEFRWLCFPEPNNVSNITVDNSFLLLENSSTFKNKLQLGIKRTLDIAGSLCGILLLSPFFILIPILIKLNSKGPVFFRQERIGCGGKKFIMLKFRSMYVNNNENIHKEFVKKLIKGHIKNAPERKISYKLENDPRVTKIGRFLRKTSLDEIPQFINVLKGEMSLVGPRPPIPYEVEEYDLWHKRRFLDVKPGITGYWQIKGRSSTSFDDMVRMDIQYIKGWSVWRDLKLLIQTPFSVILAKGAC